MRARPPRGLDAVNEAVQAANVHGDNRKPGQRTLATLMRADASIEDSVDNLKLVIALEDLGLGRLTPFSFHGYRQEVRVEEAVERDLYLIKKLTTLTWRRILCQKDMNDSWLIPARFELV